MPSPTLEQRIRDGSSREFLSDTTACVTFGIVVGGLNEAFVIGLPSYQILVSRASNTLQNLCLGGLYGKYCNTVNYLLGVGPNTGKIKKTAADIMESITFWAPLYEILLRYVVGVTDEHTLSTARASAITLCAVTGWPYNAYQRMMRGWFGCGGTLTQTSSPDQANAA